MCKGNLITRTEQETRDAEVAMGLHGATKRHAATFYFTLITYSKQQGDLTQRHCDASWKGWRGSHRGHSGDQQHRLTGSPPKGFVLLNAYPITQPGCQTHKTVATGLEKIVLKSQVLACQVAVVRIPVIRRISLRIQVVP